MSNHLSGTTIGTVRRRKSGRGTRRTTQVFEEIFLFFLSKMNLWTLVWGVPLHLFESFSHPRPRMEVFSLSLHLYSNGVRCQISIFLVLLFVFCLVGQTLAPVGGLSVLMGGSQVPLILCLFVSYTRPPTPTPTHMS